MRAGVTIAIALGLTAACGKKADEGTKDKTPPAAGNPAPATGTTPAAAGNPAPAAADPPPAAAAAAAASPCGAEPCPCEPGSEEKHHGTELLRKCKLTRAMEIQGYPVKPGSQGGEVVFDKDGKLVRFYLDREAEVKGYVGQAKTGVELFPDGSLQSINLVAPREIDGIPCTGSVTFFAGGKLRRCGISKEIELSGHRVQAEDIVTLDAGGKLHRWEVGGRTQKIGAYDCSGYLNFVHPTGELLRCGFARPTKVEGKQYQAGDLVCFDTAGKVADCTTFTWDIGGA